MRGEKEVAATSWKGWSKSPKWVFSKAICALLLTFWLFPAQNICLAAFGSGFVATTLYNTGCPCSIPSAQSSSCPRAQSRASEFPPLLVALFSHLSTAHAKQHRPAAETTVSCSKALLTWEKVDRCSKWYEVFCSPLQWTVQGHRHCTEAALWSRGVPPRWRELRTSCHKHTKQRRRDERV